MFPSGVVGRMASAIVSAIVRLTEDRAGVVGVSSAGARDLLLERNPRLNPDSVVSAPNPTDESLFRPLHSLKLESIPEVPWSDKFSVMYVGAVGEVQGLDKVLDAAQILRPNREIQIVIVGDGIARPQLLARAAAQNLENVSFVGRIDKSLVPGYMATAKVQLVSLADRKFLNYTTPSKIASLLASGAPIIGQLSGDGARLIEESRAGILATPGDGASLAAAILQMASLSESQRSEFGRYGRAYYDKNLSATVAAARVTDSLNALRS
jgi:glycosyltransferase involved in cell wall biosynthesis